MIQEINKCCQPNMSEEERQKRIKLHSILDTFYIKKAKGAYVRTRAGSGWKRGKEIVHILSTWKKDVKKEIRLIV